MLERAHRLIQDMHLCLELLGKPRAVSDPETRCGLLCFMNFFVVASAISLLSSLEIPSSGCCEDSETTKKIVQKNKSNLNKLPLHLCLVMICHASLCYTTAVELECWSNHLHAFPCRKSKRPNRFAKSKYLSRDLKNTTQFVAWRPSLLGWRPSLLGWKPSLSGWRPSLLGWRPLLVTRSYYSRLEAIGLKTVCY